MTDNKKYDLTGYHFPEDLKKMDDKQLTLLSYAIRDFLVEKVSATGGHLASNLGIVEIAIGLHKVFGSPRDRIIWDVGHQSYVHKILTGRAGGFDHLRQFHGMSGFPKACESPHDAYDTGHSSTSLSAALGMATARDLKGEDHEVIAVIGDGSLTGGMAYEALNNIGTSGRKIIMILNDNGMSISKNIGGMSEHLSNLRTSSKYLEAKRSIKNGLNRIPRLGPSISDGLSGAKGKLKYALMGGGVVFEEIGITYLGPVDGHNISEVINVLEHSRNVDGPVLIHMITKKGKGYLNAERNPDRFHGIGPFDIDTGEPLKKGGTSWSKVMGRTVTEIARDRKDIVAISAAMESATGLGAFDEEFPERFFDVGIAEAHAVTFAAGLAKGGMHPLCAIYSSFLQRAYDQILEDVCLQKLPCVLAIDRAGIVGADGETHHGLFDISYLSSMPNMRVLAPSDGDELAAMLRYAFTLEGPCAIRYPRGDCRCQEGHKALFDGSSRRLEEAGEVDVFAVGNMLETGRKVTNRLKEKGITCGLVDVRTVKPLDLSVLEPTCHTIVTLEDGVLCGGFGSALGAAVPEGIRVLSFGWPDRFIEHGSVGELFAQYGLDSVSITERICEEIEGKA